VNVATAQERYNMSAEAMERLVVLSGPLEGQAIAIEGVVSIGRSPDNSLQLDDLQVSRKHAQVERTSRGTILRDLGSGNGTYVGTRRILEYKLSNGDLIQIGSQQLRYEGEVAAAVEPELKPESGVRFQSKMARNVEAADAASIFQTFFEAGDRASTTDEVLRSTQRRLKALYEANQIISSEQDLGKLFDRVMGQIFALVPAHNGVILLKEKGAEDLVTEYVKTGVSGGEVVISSTIVKRAFANGEAVLTYDAADDDRFESGASIISQNISSAMCVPLNYQAERLGVIYVDTRGTTNAFVNTDLELLVALAAPSAIAIKNAQYVSMLERSYQDTLTALANAVELRDHYTVGHTWRVTNFALEMARELGWNEDKLREVQMGGVLHDVGKIAIPDAILGKTSKLTDEEYAVIKIHPEKGAQLLQDIERLHPLIPYCLYHHERYDGRGYPYGLAGDDIPLEGRLLAVADTFDALTSSRPYRKGLDPDVAIAEVERCKGTQFDPVCADALIRCYQQGKIQGVLQEYNMKHEKSIACPFCSTFIRFPEAAQQGDDFDCDVCHRTVLLQFDNGMWHGELRAHTQGRMTNLPTTRPEHIGSQ
jgi:HD-GYP domain-containing protein (c-di-GMP phosphodiesterase class II)